MVEGSSAINEPNTPVAAPLNGGQKEAMRSLAVHLLELHEMLKPKVG
jgi:hypothetical protein